MIMHFGWNRIRNWTETSIYKYIWIASWLEQELDWNQQLDISLAFWLEQDQELEWTESVTQGTWIRFGAGTSPDVAFWSLIGAWSGICKNQELPVHCLNVELVCCYNT